MSLGDIGRWLSLYEPFFESEIEARTFAESFESLKLGNPLHPAKIMMHQAQRLVSFADDLFKIRKNNETLPLLFLLICAENIAKLSDNFNGEGHSKLHVRNFLSWFLTPEEQDKLCTNITRNDRRSLYLQETIDALYEVRCDVVHEGKYRGFHFHDGGTPMINSEPDVVVSLTLDDFRSLVVKGCIRAIKGYLRHG
jgi:hypothetical protein